MEFYTHHDGKDIRFFSLHTDRAAVEKIFLLHICGSPFGAQQLHIYGTIIMS